MNSILPPPLADIKELYMERPGRYAHRALGLWYLEAHNLGQSAKFHQLAIEQNTEQCLSLIQSLGLEALPLEDLKAWNIEHGKDPF
jgi:hypothetical protein